MSGLDYFLFQFLVGTLKTKNVLIVAESLIPFQFLVGTLKT